MQRISSHSSDRITVFKSQIGTFFESAKSKKKVSVKLILKYFGSDVAASLMYYKYYLINLLVLFIHYII